MLKKLSVLILILSFPLFAANTNKNYVFIEALYWEMREGGAENWGQIIPPASSTQNITVLEVPFKWAPGFRLGVGRQLQYDGWDTNFYYTRYQAKGTDSAIANSGGIYSPFLGNFFVNNTSGGSISAYPHYGSASINWKLFFNTFDLELGRKFVIAPLLQIRPFVGIKIGIINQHIFSNWNNPVNVNTFTSAVENLRNDFWGIGPSIGFDTSWKIYKKHKSTLNVFANFSGALMWGHWEFSDVYQNNIPLSVAVKVSNVNGACTVGRGLLGIEWKGAWYKQEVGVRLGYEMQVWFDQVQFYSYNMGRLNSLMSMQGAILGIYINI